MAAAILNIYEVEVSNGSGLHNQGRYLNALYIKYLPGYFALLLIIMFHKEDPPGGTQVYRYVPPQRVWFLSRFGLKTGIDFEHFGLKVGVVIRGMFTKTYKLIFLSSNRCE